MPDPSLETVQLHAYIQRWQAGDAKAADELFRAIGNRLEHLARRMLKGYPNVRCWADTADVFQGTVWRLLHTLQKLQPATTRDFYNLAAAHVRRELLDLARRYSGKVRPGNSLDEGHSSQDPAVSESLEPAELELWSRFHEAVEKLPVEEREIFGLVFYHGWSQPAIAELFDIHERTVRRRWQGACLQLARLLGGQLPVL